MQRKPQLDIDTELDNSSTSPSSSEDSEPVRKKPRLDIDMILDDDSTSPSSSEDSEQKPRLDIDTEIDDGSTSPSSSQEFQKPPFGCGCGNCTLSSFIERGCPKPISSENSFPNLNLSKLTDKQKEDFRNRLQCESEDVMMQFQKLVSATIESLIRQNVSLRRLVSHIMTLVAFDPVYKKPQVPLFQDHLKELETAEDIPQDISGSK